MRPSRGMAQRGVYEGKTGDGWDQTVQSIRLVSFVTGMELSCPSSIPKAAVSD